MQPGRAAAAGPAGRRGRNFVSNSLVVIVPAGRDGAAEDPGRPRRPGGEDRSRSACPASVPVGRYTKAVLEKAQLWPAIEAKMIGAQIGAPGARLRRPRRGRRRLRLRHRCGDHAGQGQGRLRRADRARRWSIRSRRWRRARNPAAAQKFVAYVLSPAGQARARAARLRQALGRPWRPPGSRSASRSRSRSGRPASTWCSASPSASRWPGYRFPGRELVDSILLLPMVLPPTVLGYYLLVVIGRRGWLGGWLERHASAST